MERDGKKQVPFWILDRIWVGHQGIFVECLEDGRKEVETLLDIF